MSVAVAERGITGVGRIVARLLVVVALALGLLVGPSVDPDMPLGAGPAAAAAKPSAKSTSRLDELVGFLQDTQNDDGGYGGSPGAESDPMISAWVGIGLAAAGINPQDQKPPGARSTSVASYLAKQGPIRVGGQPPVTTEFARIGMFVNAAGMDARTFGGRDYVTPLLARQSGAPSTVGEVTVPAGWFPHAHGGTVPGVNDTIFAIFFLSGLNDRSVRPQIRQATEAVMAMQRPDGTWPATRPGDGTNVDMTGAAVQALCVAGRCKTDAVKRAIDYLRRTQQSDGGWQAGDMADEQQGESNSGTTPWVVQALWAVGEDPETWKRGGKDPLQFLASLQRRDGS
ncbi:MAG: prenyltransferase/squalene oxidase repeat-containing protein, partial [Patulibacter sp.]